MFIRDSRRSYKAYSYAGLILITDLFSVRTPVGVTELILCRTYTYNRLIFSRDSCRSYRTYTYSELILIQNLYLTDLCLFRTPVGVTELILIQNLYLTELCLFRTPVGVTELILNRLMFIQDSRRSYRSYSYAKVPVGTISRN